MKAYFLLVEFNALSVLKSCEMYVCLFVELDFGSDLVYIDSKTLGCDAVCKYCVLFKFYQSICDN